MKAIGFKESLPIAEENSFISFELPKPTATGHDLLVKVQAVSVNPVDFKVRRSAAKDQVLEIPKVIGYDAVGVVESVGSEVSKFKVGDEVYYAGDFTRSGSNAEYQLVDERIVGHKPKNLSAAESVAIPLTGLTAWESIFDRMKINSEVDHGKTVLIIGGAGGVGSIAIQLAKKVAGLTVIATSSRSESKNWCLEMGADHVVNHQALKTELDQIGHSQVDYILDFVDINSYWETVTEIIKPQGHIVTIAGNSTPLNLALLKNKSVTFSWEFMFTRPIFTTEDIDKQHEILEKLAELLDNDTLKTTLTTTLRGMSVDNFKRAHELQESGKTIGKTVIEFY